MCNLPTVVRHDLFEGCIVCVAGGSKEERRKVKELVERYDGLFLDDPVADLDTCSHMLVWKAEGNFLTIQQYHFIHCTSNYI